MKAVLVSPGKIRVSDVGSEAIEKLDFSGSRVVEMSIGFGHLVAATHNQVGTFMVVCLEGSERAMATYEMEHAHRGGRLRVPWLRNGPCPS